MSNFELIITLRYLFTKKKEPFIRIINSFSLIGISLGVATLIIVMSVMNGYEKEIVKKILGVKGHINIEYMQDLKTDKISGAEETKEVKYKEIVEKLEKISEIKTIIPIVENQAMITHENMISGAFIKGMKLEDIIKKPLIDKSIISGNWEGFDTKDEIIHYNIVIGSIIADNLGLKIGDTVKLLSPTFNNNIFGSIPRSKTFNIVGIFDIGMYDYNSSIVFMPLKTAQIFFNKTNDLSFLEITLNNLNDVNTIKNQIEKNLDSNWHIIDWQLLNQGLVEALKVERSVMFFILTLIILIATFNIISSLMILVKDKQKSIAILKTMGATKNSIMRIFIMSGFFIGFSGTIIGAIIGLTFSYNIENIRVLLSKITGINLFDPVIYWLTTLPSEISIYQVIMIVFLSIFCSLIATIYPAIKIANIAPANVLRYE